MIHSKDLRGIRLSKHPGTRRKLGKIRACVCTEDARTVCGFMVKRSDLLWMVKRSDVFVALDSCEEKDGILVPTKGRTSFNKSAAKRLKINLDHCLVLEGMDAQSQRGEYLGRISSLVFNWNTGDVHQYCVDDGASARSLVGSVHIPVIMLEGYARGAVIFDAAAEHLSASGGLAQKAGAVKARVGSETKKVGERISHSAQERLDDGAVRVGRVLGKVKRSVTSPISAYKVQDNNTQDAATISLDSGIKNNTKSSTSSAAHTTSTHTSLRANQTSDKAAQAGQALGKHLKRTSSMFSAFAEEYKKGKSDS